MKPKTISFPYVYFEKIYIHLNFQFIITPWFKWIFSTSTGEKLLPIYWPPGEST